MLLSRLKNKRYSAQKSQAPPIFLLDYKNIDTLEPLGKLIMEIDVDTLLNAGDLIGTLSKHMLGALRWRGKTAIRGGGGPARTSGAD